MRKLKRLEDENARLRRIVADLTLDKQIVQKVVRKKSLKAAKRRELTTWMKASTSVPSRTLRTAAMGRNRAPARGSRAPYRA